MLTTIREKTQGWIAGIILGLLAVPFALWGVNSYFETDAKLIVARVGDQDIGVNEYKNALEEQRRSLQQTFGRGLNQKLLDSPEFKMRTLDDLIDQALLAQDAQARGYHIGNDELARRIAAISFFQRAGRFDQQAYTTALRTLGLNVRSFEARMRREAMVKQAVDGFAYSTIVTKADKDALLRLETQARQTTYVVIKPQQYMDTVAVTAQGVEDYYASNVDKFKTPERARIEYIRFSAVDLSSKIHISEEDLQKAYAQELGRYTSPEQRRASHVLIQVAEGPDGGAQALQKIQELRKQLISGTDFATLAKKHSADPGSAAKGGDLGYLTRNGSMVKEFEDALFNLKKGELSQPVRTSYGYHLIKLVDLKPLVHKTFKEVRDEIESALRIRKAEEQFYELSEKLRNLAYEQPDSLKPVAEALGLTIAQSDWFTRSGGEGIAADARIAEAAFDPDVLVQGRNSSAIETAPNTLVVLRVSAHQEAATLPLSAVRDQILILLKQRLAQDAAKQASGQLLQQLQQGASLATLAKSHAWPVVASKSITRHQPQGMDPKLLDAVFAAPRLVAGKPVYGSADVGEGYAVYALESVQEGIAGADADAELKNLANRLLSERRGRDYFANYRSGLRQETKPKIYPDRL